MKGFRDRAQGVTISGLWTAPEMEFVDAATLGEAWLEVSRRILDTGADAAYDGLATKELALVTVRIRHPDPADALIASLADPEWLEWMRRNFTEPDDVPELGGARSYARRLRDYDGRDQVAWVIDRLAPIPRRGRRRSRPSSRSDTTYPCVSLLDFWRAGGGLELVVYAHCSTSARRRTGTSSSSRASSTRSPLPPARGWVSS